MTTRKQKKSGNVSRSEPKQVNPLIEYEQFPLGAFNRLEQINDYECVHNNWYSNCQQCESRIRNQDILDRIEYCIKNSYSDEGYTITQNEDGYIRIIPVFLTSTAMMNLKKEMTSFFFSNGTFQTGEGYN